MASMPQTPSETEQALKQLSRLFAATSHASQRCINNGRAGCAVYGEMTVGGLNKNIIHAASHVRTRWEAGIFSKAAQRWYLKERDQGLCNSSSRQSAPKRHRMNE